MGCSGGILELFFTIDLAGCSSLVDGAASEDRWELTDDIANDGSL